MERFGWRPFFVTLGVAALLWLPLWWAWMPRRRDPYSKPLGATAGVLDILRQRSAWGTCIGQASINYYLYFLVTWLPFYLVRGRHMSLTEMARIGGVVFLLSAIASAISGRLGDRWIRAGTSTTIVRKGLMVLGHTGVGIFLILSVIAAGKLFFVAIAMTGVFLGIAVCNSWAISQTLAGPRMVGRWIGVQNFIGNLGGAVAPALTGFLLDRTGSFYWPFIITAIVAWIGAAAWWFVVGPLEQVDWDKISRGALGVTASPAPQSS